MIIDSTYFEDQIAIPTDNPYYSIDRFIEKAEKKYLTKVLGYELYSLFNAELPTPTSLRFTNILEGAEFTNRQGNLDYWPGLKNDDKESMIAYFAYYLWSFKTQTNAGNQGSTGAKFENSEKVSPAEKQAWAYNMGVDQYYKLYEYLYANSTDYPELVFQSLNKINEHGI